MSSSAPTATSLTFSARFAVGVALLVAIARPFHARSAAEPEVVSQHGGRALALGGNASRLFVGWGQRVATVRRADIDDAGGGSPPLERVSPLLTMRVGMLAVDGDYVLVGDSGSGISLLFAAADGSLALRAHMAAIDQPGRDLSFGPFAFKYPFAFLPGTSALKVLDVSGDRNVIEVARFQKPNEVFESVLVTDDGIVLAGSRDGGRRTPGVYAIDASTPEHPRERSFLGLPGTVEGLARDGSVAYAYVVDAGTSVANSSVASVYILDVAHFDHPSVLGHVEVGGAVGSSASAWMDDIGPFHAGDHRRGGVASPLSFRAVQEVWYGPPSHVRLFPDGDKLRVFDGRRGLALVDVADPLWPRVLDPFDDGLRGVDAVAFGDAILISSGLQRIHRVPVAPSSTEPTRLASIDLPDSPSFEAVATSGDQTVATRFDWLSLALSIGRYRVDGATIEGPIAITSIPGPFDRPPATRIVVGVRGAYVAVEKHGVYWAEDHGDATGSAMATMTTLPVDTLALFLHGERALSVTRAGDVSAWDVTDLVRPRLIVSTTLTHRISDTVLAWPYLVVGGPVDDVFPNSRISYVDVSGTERLFTDAVVDVENERIAYLTGDASVTYAAGGGLTVVERIERRDPVVTMRARYLFPGGVRALVTRGSVVSVLAFSSGGRIVRYALPLSEQPLELSSHALFGGPRGMAMLGDDGFVVANGSDGLLVLGGTGAAEPQASPVATDRAVETSGRVYLPSVLKDESWNSMPTSQSKAVSHTRGVGDERMRKPARRH